MPLYLLKRLATKPEYDVVTSIIVRAYNPKCARDLAASEAMDEKASTWKSSKRSSCTRLYEDGAAMVLCVNANAG